MNVTEPWHERRENVRVLLQEMLDDHSPEDDDAWSVCVTSHFTADYHHSLAILDFVLDGDAESFFAHLYQSASCRYYYLMRVLGGLEPDVSHMAATVDSYFFDGVASGHPERARKLSRAMTSRRLSQLDDINRYVFSTTARLLADSASADRLRQENAAALPSADRTDPRVRTILAIQDGAAQDVDQAFRALLTHREEEIEAGVVTNEVDKVIFVEGLALLRISRQLGINLEVDHPLVPTVLQREPERGPPASGHLELTEQDRDRIRARLQQ